MKIRAMQMKDMEEVVGMMRVFYDSPAVIHAAPDKILRQDVKRLCGETARILRDIFLKKMTESWIQHGGKKVILQNMAVCVSGWKIFT